MHSSVEISCFFLYVNVYYEIQRMVITWKASSMSSIIGSLDENAILAEDAQRLLLLLEFKSVKA